MCADSVFDKSLHNMDAVLPAEAWDLVLGDEMIVALDLVGCSISARLAVPRFAAAEHNFRRAAVISHTLLTSCQVDLQSV